MISENLRQQIFFEAELENASTLLADPREGCRGRGSSSINFVLLFRIYLSFYLGVPTPKTSSQLLLIRWPCC